MPRKLTLEEFIQRAREKHGDKYSYDKVIYINNSTKVEITCPEHGYFWQAPIDHMCGKGCKRCAGNMIGEVNLFIEKANLIHKNKYDYSKFVYVNSKEKGIIICNTHGEFLQSAEVHMRGHGCSSCARNAPYDTKSFIQKSIEIHGENKYDYSNFQYIGNDIPSVIICNVHGQFNQTPHSHFAGRGCSKCSSNYSNKCKEWIDSFKNPNIKMGAKLRINGKLFEFDGYDPTTNTIYEFYGNFWHGKSKRYKDTDVNPLNKKTFLELYQNTIIRENVIKNFGFVIISIWEDEWDKIKEGI